jgi:UDP-N-acetylglucosamine--N-acetylmuramyl-(pentapeptide) pyrophosphoryl-undecaprenol N-acetylglucosamine transferase
VSEPGADARARSERRPLRVLLVANDGFSAGHIARTIAIARGLARRGAAREITLRLLLATTSEAHALLAGEGAAVVHLPAPLAARRAGFSDAERRRLVRDTLGALAASFAPDLLVADTFPSGPHGELDGVGARARRAIVRRSVPDEREGDATLTKGLAAFHLAIVADDPHPVTHRLPIPSVRVPPITMGEARDGLSRQAARAELGLPAEGRVIVVAAGGGGDPEAALRATALAEAAHRVAPEATVVLALGPLAPLPRAASASATVSAATVSAAVRVVRAAPLQPLLAAFDGAFSPAGYNTAHELCKAGVPAALFAQPRPFDDQAARAARFADASLAHALTRFDDDAVARALAWMSVAPRPVVEAGGADRAADALLDLATGAR